MSKLFVNSPARRDLYIKLNTNSDFPLKFCAARWTENEDVGDRAILTWSSVKSVIKHFLSLSQNARTKSNKSFDTLVQYHSSAFMIVKFDALVKFPVKFETDSPMTPFYVRCSRDTSPFTYEKICFHGQVRTGKHTIQINQVGSRLPIDQV